MLVSCTKQNGCEKYNEYREGTLVVLEEPYYYEKYDETYCARFFPVFPPDDDFEGIGIVGKLPNKYKKGDTVKVGIAYTNTVNTTNRIPVYKIKCIEQIN